MEELLATSEVMTCMDKTLWDSFRPDSFAAADADTSVHGDQLNWRYVPALCLLHKHTLESYK